MATDTELKELRAKIKELRKEKAARTKAALEKQLEETSGEAIREAVDQINRLYAVVKMGASVRILCEGHDPEFDRPTVDFMRVGDFRVFLNNHRLAIGEKGTSSAADLWLASPLRRQYDGVIFAPGSEDPRYYNLWRGFAVEPREGCWVLLRQHIQHNICQGDTTLFRYILAWLAEPVRQPCGRKPGVVLALKGKKGTGKSELGRHYGKLFGAHYRMIDKGRHLVGNFNGHLANALIVNAEEAFWAGDKAAEGALKSLITAPSMALEKKGQDVIEVPNRVRLLMTSNENWMVPAGMDERRFCVIEVGEAHRQDHAYFAAIDRQMREGGYEAMLYDLLYDPAIDIGAVSTIPMTKALLEQKIRTLGDIPAFWYHCLERGYVVPERAWIDPLPCDEVYEEYLEFAKQLGAARRSSPTGFGMELHNLCEGVVRRRRPVEIWSTNDSGYRVRDTQRTWCYLLPDLPTARASFTVRMQMPIPWPKDEE